MAGIRTAVDDDSGGDRVRSRQAFGRHLAGFDLRPDQFPAVAIFFDSRRIPLGFQVETGGGDLRILAALAVVGKNRLDRGGKSVPGGWIWFLAGRDADCSKKQRGKQNRAGGNRAGLQTEQISRLH